MSTGPRTHEPLLETSNPKRHQRARLGRLGRGIIARFTFFALLTLIIMVVAIFYAGWRQYENNLLLQKQSAEWTAGVLDTWLRRLFYGLEAEARPGLLNIPSEAVEKDLTKILNSNPFFRSVTLADAQLGRQGQEIMTVSHLGSSTGKNFHGDGWFRFALEKGRFISRVNLAGDIPVATLSQAIQHNGQTVAVIGVQVDLSWARELLAWASIGREDYLYVVDYIGRPLLHQDISLAQSRESRVEDIPGIAAAVEGKDMLGLYPGLNRERENVVGVFSPPLHEAEWTVISEQPVHVLVEELLPLAGGAAGVILLGAIAALVVGAYISRRVARPIMLLGQSAQRIGAGDLEHRISMPGHNELTDLAEELGRMAENVRASQVRLEARSHELEERVSERTDELSQALDQLRREAQVREHLLQTIREMSSPVIPIVENIAVTPIVGTMDSERARRMMDDILSGIEREGTQVIILDITGLAIVDTAVANALLQTAQSAELLGAQPILVGISPAVAGTLIDLGVELANLRTAATLQEGLHIALAILRRQVVSR